MELYAHISDDGSRKQTVYDHLHGTAKLAEYFARSFGGDTFALRAGYLHDIGKYQRRFQKRLAGESVVCDHSTPGAIEAKTRGDLISAFCIAGHHAGLPDLGSAASTCDAVDLLGRMKRNEFDDYSAWTGAVPETEVRWPEWLLGIKDVKAKAWSQSFFTRMIFSCLVDADYLDTEAFMLGREADRHSFIDIKKLNDKFNQYVQAKYSIPRHELDQVRTEIRESCDQRSSLPPSLQTLTVPTGGGKTITSLSYALKHAAEHGMERIIYIIPYTSIIEQTAAQFRTILGANNVIEHHSHVRRDPEEATANDPLIQRQKLAMENWDAPIIISTAVQFFDSCFAARSSQCRKLHNLANAVIVFDEAQMLPLQCLLPCLAVITELVQYYHSTAVLCTATQPNLNGLVSYLAPSMQINELCRPSEKWPAVFQRVTYIKKKEPYSYESLSSELIDRKQALCIVNTRKHAQKLLQIMPENTYHLSTLMTPYHREKVLRQIRADLTNNRDCRVISTSMIEAGVDVDFPVVFREACGLDSIIQSAGRCNREGKRDRDQSKVIVFRLEGEAIPSLFARNYSAMEITFDKFLSFEAPEAIKEYYRSLYMLTGYNPSSDRNLIGMAGFDRYDAIEKSCRFMFRRVADEFRLIDQNTYSLYLEIFENQKAINTKILEKLQSGYANREDFRELGRYAVQVYPHEFESLLKMNVVTLLDERSGIIWGGVQYDERKGLVHDQVLLKSFIQ